LKRSGHGRIDGLKRLPGLLAGDAGEKGLSLNQQGGTGHERDVDHAGGGIITMSLVEVLADVARSVLDSSGAPGDPGGWTTGGAGPAAGGMGDGGPGSGSGQGQDSADGNEGDGNDATGADSGDGGSGGTGDASEPEQGSWDGVEQGWEKAKDDLKDIFDELFDMGKRAAKGELTEDEKIVWDAAKTGGKDAGDLALEAGDAMGIPGMTGTKAAKDAVKYAEVGMDAYITGKKAKATRDFDKHHPGQHRGEIKKSDD
jgi:hypothetical protein